MKKIGFLVFLQFAVSIATFFSLLSMPEQTFFLALAIEFIIKLANYDLSSPAIVDNILVNIHAATNPTKTWSELTDLDGEAYFLVKRIHFLYSIVLQLLIILCSKFRDNY